MNINELFEQNRLNFIEKEFKSKLKDNPNTENQYKDYSHCFQDSLDINDLHFFELAVMLAYNDTQRTLKGIGEIWTTYKKSNFFKDIAEQIQNIFITSPLELEHEFDDKHIELCTHITDQKFFNFTYGHAQKIINMAFKYLSCMTDADKYNEIFKQCHMPLDSRTLEWYKRTYFYNTCDNPTDKLTSDDTWSKLTLEKYKVISELIKKNLKNPEQTEGPAKDDCFSVYKHINCLPQCPLEAEFIIWPEMQLHLAAENFIFTYNDKENLSKDKKTEIKMKNLAEKLSIITNLINTYQNKHKSNITT